ncbi:MAG: rRNA maturation RNase YbeY [Epulopiscium sp.]|nr:rRNA maturation RNase YbeY [Candidatus Epulonipiscium sp.]
MTIWIENSTTTKISKEIEKMIEHITETTLEEEEYPVSVEVSITFVSDEEIRDLNKEHRGIDQVTDVLSFPMIDFTEGYCSFDEIENLDDYVNPDTEELILGDIIISLDKAQEQSIAYGHSFEREIGFLVTHSLLHLIGYDHLEHKEEKVMEEKQEIILQKVGLPR